MKFHHINDTSVESAGSHNQVTVDNVRPLYGPLSGGTRVTITGQFVGMSTVTAVIIGPYSLNLAASR